MEDTNILVEQRLEKLDELVKKGINPFPNKFEVNEYASRIKQNYETYQEKHVKIAGRLMLARKMGKASFITVKDSSGDIQAYIREKELGADVYGMFKKQIDIGDIVGVTGKVFKTNSGEVTVLAEEFILLSKSLRPLPEKFHGLKDPELRYRQRYVDLIMNDKVRDAFRSRSLVIKTIRDYLDNLHFLEVETPALQPVYGGAAARPFITHHNTYKTDLYLRIAPELYLKRLLVGGFTRVYEIGKSFRNEGISIKHNPEFTMLELYQAYADYNVMMEICENLISLCVRKISDECEIDFNGQKISFKTPFERMTLKESVLKYASVDCGKLKGEELKNAASSAGLEKDKILSMSDAEVIQELFEKQVEAKLIQPVFITDYPKEISPLAKSKEGDEDTVERFELIVAGREIANAYSELNNPLEQKKRFLEQLEKGEKGDEEAHRMDEDYVRALEYGMPPAGGLGIGIDRLVMLLTGNESIREVILFPLLRK